MHKGGVVSHAQNDSSALVTFDSTLSQNLSTMSQSWTNVIQSLVDSQTKQYEVIQKGFERHNELIQRGFDRLIACMSSSPNKTKLESASEVVDLLDDFELKEDNHSASKPHDGSISLVLKRPDGVPRRIHLPSYSDLFKSLGGESRKTEEKNPPVDLAQLLCAVAWSVFADEKNKTILPFVLDWDPKDYGTDYVKNWEAELNCWYGTKAFKKLGAAIVMVDGKLCLAVFYIPFDDDDDVYRPKLSIITPQTLKNSELPEEELKTFFELIFAVGKDGRKYAETIVQKVFPADADENVKYESDEIATGVEGRELTPNFSMEKRAKGRNDFSDALFWFVVICCAGKKEGGKKDDHFFSTTKTQLCSYAEKDDPSGYRQSICDAFAEASSYLVEKKYLILENDINGKPLGGSATTADFLSESKKYAQMKKQKQREPNSNSGKFFCDVNIFHLSYFTHSVMFSAEQKLKRKSDQIPSSAGAGKKAKQNKMPSSKSKKQN